MELGNGVSALRSPSGSKMKVQSDSYTLFDTANALVSTYKTHEKRGYSSRIHVRAPAQREARHGTCIRCYQATEESKPDVERRVLRIEENLRRTRKITRASVRSERALEVALLPFTQCRESKPSDSCNRVETRRMRTRQQTDRCASLLGGARHPATRSPECFRTADNKDTILYWFGVPGLAESH